MDKYKVPMEWVDRIFLRLAEAYGSKFAERFSRPVFVDIEKTRWQSGLYGLTPDEIKHVLNLCRQRIIADPPNVIEFYHYAKGIKQPIEKKKTDYTRTESQQKTGEKYIKLILDKLHGRIDSEGEAALSAINQQVLGEQANTPKKHWTDD